MSQAGPAGTKAGSSNAYASSSGNQDLFNVARQNFGMGQLGGPGGPPGATRQVIREPQQPQQKRGKMNIFCTAILFILLVICILIGAAGIALCVVYFNTDTSSQGFKIGGIVMGAVVIIVGIVLIILAIFKQTHKRPWKQKKEKNFFYSQDARRHPEKADQINVEDLVDNDRRMYGDKGQTSSNQYTGRGTNSYAPLNNSYGGSTTSYGPLNTSYEVQSTKSMNQSTPVTGATRSQPVTYSLADPKPGTNAYTTKPFSTTDPSGLNSGSYQSFQYQTTTRAPQQDLITFPAQNQPVSQTPRSTVLTTSRPSQSTVQTSRQDLISFVTEDDEKASRNRETFTAFDRPATNSTLLRTSQTGVLPTIRSAATENVVVRRVPLTTTKAVTPPASTVSQGHAQPA